MNIRKVIPRKMLFYNDQPTYFFLYLGWHDVDHY